jgi:regulator of replication initiation timing
MVDNQNKEYLRRLSQSYKELEKVKEVNGKLTYENKELKIEISDLKTADKQLTKTDGGGQIDEGNKWGNSY